MADPDPRMDGLRWGAGDAALVRGERLRSEGERWALATAETWWKQEEGYLPSAVGVGFVYAARQCRSDALVIMRASAFRRVTGFEASDMQLSLALNGGG